MTYPLLEQAPKDHMSEEFLQFLRDNNEVIEETPWWLVVANCKYDTPEKRWYTAFFKHGIGWNAFDEMRFLYPRFGHLNWLIKAPKDRSVKRFHVHLTEQIPKYGTNTDKEPKI